MMGCVSHVMFELNMLIPSFSELAILCELYVLILYELFSLGARQATKAARR